MSSSLKSPSTVTNNNLSLIKVKVNLRKISHVRASGGRESTPVSNSRPLATSFG